MFISRPSIEDPELAFARQMLSRAADVIGGLEDAIVFNGQPGEDYPPANTGNIPKVYTVRGGKHAGPISAEGEETNARPGADKTDERPSCTVTVDLAKGGDDLVGAVNRCHPGPRTQRSLRPFCLRTRSFVVRSSQYPSQGALVLPPIASSPFLDSGPLRRSSVGPDRQGVVVALKAHQSTWLWPATCL
jgi:hypothetical protein